jgi:hypothetical protein
MTDEVRKSDATSSRPERPIAAERSRAQPVLLLRKTSREDVKLGVLDGGGSVIRSFQGKPGEAVEERPAQRFGQGDGEDPKLPRAKGSTIVGSERKALRIEGHPLGRSSGLKVVPDRSTASLVRRLEQTSPSRSRSPHLPPPRPTCRPVRFPERRSLPRSGRSSEVLGGLTT